MSRRRIALVHVACVVLLSGTHVGAQSAKPEPLRYKVTVTRDAGRKVIDFETMAGPAKLSLPDNLVAGEQFSGQFLVLWNFNSGTTFVLEAAGQQVKASPITRDKNFVWRVPAEDASLAITFVLRSEMNDELARVQIPVLPQAPSLRPLLGFTSSDFVVPSIVQSGAVFPIVGPFDGDSRHTRFTVRGTDAELLTESTREAIFRLPAIKSGLADYVLTHDGIEHRGRLRVVDLETTYRPPTRSRTVDVNYGDGELVTTINGLSGLTTELAVRIDNYTPALVNASTGWKPEDKGPIFFINPRDVGPDGVYEFKHPILDYRQPTTRPVELVVSLVFPRSAAEQVSLVLQVPRRDPTFTRLPYDEHADALRPYLPDVLVTLAEFLSNPRAGFGGDPYEAYRTMITLDADAAAPLILSALPSMFGQAQGEAFALYTERARSPAAPHRKEVHDAAAQLVSTGGFIPAFRALGNFGSEADFPLLERLYQQADLRHDTVVRNAAADSLAKLRLALAPHNQTGSLRGTVTDTTGGVLPGATVTVTSGAIIRTEITERDGTYTLKLLPGTYIVEAELQAFKKQRREITVNVEEEVTANFVLEISAWISEGWGWTKAIRAWGWIGSRYSMSSFDGTLAEDGNNHIKSGWNFGVERDVAAIRVPIVGKVTIPLGFELLEASSSSAHDATPSAVFVKWNVPAAGLFAAPTVVFATNYPKTAQAFFRIGVGGYCLGCFARAKLTVSDRSGELRVTGMAPGVFMTIGGTFGSDYRHAGLFLEGGYRHLRFNDASVEPLGGFVESLGGAAVQSGRLSQPLDYSGVLGRAGMVIRF